MKNFDVVIGAQWGDEGKGKIIDHLIKEYNGTIRYNGGANAGHTVYVGGTKVVLHQLPIAVLSGKEGFIGNGCVVDLMALISEIKLVEEIVGGKLNLSISDLAHVVLPVYKEIDQHENEHIGTTNKGIGPTYSAKFSRKGTRIKDLTISSFSGTITEEGWNIFIKPIIDNYVVDGMDLIMVLNTEKNRRYLLEGAQGFGLDIDFGTYPYVTSSNTGAAGACTGSGISPTRIGKIIGIAKAYTTRVGNGPFMELKNDIGDLIRERGKEYGATTGRPRRVGWLDISQLKESCIINNISELAINKLDILTVFKQIHLISSDPRARVGFFDGDTILPGWTRDIMGIQSWNDLPDNAKHYIDTIESKCQTHVKYIGTGPNSEDLIVR